MVTLKLRYVYHDVDRHGNVRSYVWRGKGHPKVRIRELVGSDAFLDAYRAALDGTAAAAAKRDPRLSRPAPGTLRWLCVEYQRSSAFMGLDARTRYVRKLQIDHILEEPTAPGAATLYADFPVGRFSAKAVRIVRDRKADFPESANARVKALRRVFAWAIENETPGVRGNPAADVAYLKGREGGFHSWTAAEVEQFEARHPIGTKPRLALALLLLLGVRRSDVVLLGRQHVRDGWLRFTVWKGRNKRPMMLELPVLPALREIIDASPTGDLTFLVTKFGKPFTINGFGTWFGRRCAEAGLTGCSAHGLRKAGAVIAAENGASEPQLMSIFGWLTAKEAARYTRAARRKKMAGDAMKMLIRVGP